MAIRGFKKLNQPTAEVSKLQDNLEEFFVPFTSSLVVPGNLLQNVSLVAGQPNIINHRLNRALVSYFVRLKGNSVVWDEQDSNLFKTKTLDLRCSADVVVDVWVF